jgi:hypothetical protein
MCSQTTILDKTFEMIELGPSDSEPCSSNEMKKIMERLERISDEYTDTCIDEMRLSECYKRCHSMMAGIDPECICRFAGRRNCMYKAAIVAFIYKYTKNISLKDWVSSFWNKRALDKQISIYANNLFSHLRPGDNIDKLPETIPDESCIAYMSSYFDGEKYSTNHSFLMISFENYFIIYDAWGYVREKWVRAMTKDDVFYILNTISAPSPENPTKKRKSSISEKSELFNYFFHVKANISHTIKFNYLSLSDEIFRNAYDNSIRRSLIFGGKRKTKRRSRIYHKIT